MVWPSTSLPIVSKVPRKYIARDDGENDVSQGNGGGPNLSRMIEDAALFKHVNEDQSSVSLLDATCDHDKRNKGERDPKPMVYQFKRYFFGGIGFS
jgi:hypothetical protein